MVVVRSGRLLGNRGNSPPLIGVLLPGPTVDVDVGGDVPLGEYNGRFGLGQVPSRALGDLWDGG